MDEKTQQAKAGAMEHYVNITVHKKLSTSTPHVNTPLLLIDDNKKQQVKMVLRDSHQHYSFFTFC